MSLQRLLIVHPDPSARALLDSMLKSLGHQIDEAPNERVAVRMLEHHPADLVLASIASQSHDGDTDAMEFLTYLRRKYQNLPVLMLCHEIAPEHRREASIRGIKSVLRFPMPATQLRAAVTQALGTLPEKPGHSGFRGQDVSGQGGLDLAPASRNGSRSPRGLDGQASLEADPTPSIPSNETIIGECPTLVQTLAVAANIASAPAPVLILGERGTGKSLLARRIHQLSPRGNGGFVEVACATLKESALEIELFGQSGPTPGQPDRPGKIAQAEGGTLYLDEVSSLSPSLQFKLLRLIRFGEYEPVGSTQTARADCRIMASSCEPLNAMVEEKHFRSDLFYALSVATMKLQPLRERGHDITLLAEAFLERFALASGRRAAGFSDEALKLLQRHDWPGNVLELRAAVEHAVLLGRGRRVEPEDLSLASTKTAGPSRVLTDRSRSAPSRGILPLKEALEGPEKQLILEALQALNWNRQETARRLDINRTTLYKKMKKYGLLYDEPVWAN